MFRTDLDLPYLHDKTLTNSDGRQDASPSERAKPSDRLVCQSAFLRETVHQTVLLVPCGTWQTVGFDREGVSPLLSLLPQTPNFSCHPLANLNAAGLGLVYPTTRSLLYSIDQGETWTCDGGQLSLSTQSINHKVDLPWLILHHKVKFSQEVLPPSLLRSQLLLIEEVASGNIVGLYHELGSQQIMPPCS
ncbi:Retrovirus-related Pol polyprotein [Senna tora]|uniref:Retrovirus-related Pol polyprotein n=1 Tax=Senna tora TaxID=362788 RepID=A0A834WFP9_9FABA|nr:Retrovirus-related Pol polyprotein [Senna tora]